MCNNHQSTGNLQLKGLAVTLGLVIICLIPFLFVKHKAVDTSEVRKARVILDSAIAHGDLVK